MDIADLREGGREFWVARSGLVRETADNLRDWLRSGGPAGRSRVRRDLEPSAAARFAEVTGGDPVLQWTATAAATAVMFRRMGAGDRCVLLTGAPLTAQLPILAETRGDMTFRELLAQLRTAVAEALMHAPSAALAWPEGNAGPGPVLIGQSGPGAPVDAALAFEIGAGSIEATSNTVGTELLGSMVASIAEVLRQGMADPTQVIIDIGVLDAVTRDQVVTGFNQNRSVTGETPYRDLVLGQAASQPAGLAVHDESHEVSYSDLCRFATVIAIRLRECGAGPDQVVALVAQRDAWFVVAAVGILFSGAAYLPVEPSIPAARRERMLTGVALVIAEDGVEWPAGSVDQRWLSFADLRRAAEGSTLQPTAQVMAERLGAAPQPHDLAYVIFTSGSTGEPKGASLEHRSFLNFLRLRALDCQLRPGVELPQTAPMSFDISVWQMFAPLTVGATVCVLPNEIVQDPASMIRMIIEHRYEHIELVPTFIAVLLEQLAAQPALGRAIRQRLRGLISTGEVLSVDLAQSWHTALPDVPLSNAYGPAECTDDVAQGPVTMDTDGTSAPVGRPLPNARIYVLDTDLQLMPPGLVGDIFIGGENVGRGYFREPRLTAAAFLPDPYAVVPGQRMYQTGDRGRWRAGGVLEILGRADTQVKLRGRRVELGEIAHVLGTHSDVTMAAVELVKDDGVERLVAFVVGAPHRTPTADVLKAHLAERMPSYMVPHLVVLLDELPCNQNGKVDHIALRQFAAAYSHRDEEYVAPRDEAERMLCAIWAAQLKAGQVGIRNDFYALGGDSIVSIRIVQAAKRRGMTLRPRHMLQERTVEAVVAALRSPAADDEAQPATELTLPQRWFFSQQPEDPCHWNVACLLCSAEPLDAVRLAASLRQVVARHDPLRTTFTAVDGDLRQVVGPAGGDLLWRATEVPGGHQMIAGPQIVRTGTLDELATAVHSSLSLSQGPVFRALLIDDDRLLLSAHRLVIDEVSLSAIVADLTALYLAGPGGLVPPWPPVVAVRDRAPQHLPGSAGPVSLAPGRPWLAVPVDGTIENAYGGRAVATLRLDTASTTRLARRAILESDDGLRAVLMAGLARSMARTLGEGQLHVLLTEDGRTGISGQADLSHTVGWFAAWRLVYLEISPGATPESVAAALACAPPSDAASPPAGMPVQVGFEMQSPVATAGELFAPGGPVPGQLRAARAARSLEWEITAVLADAELTIELEHVPARHDPSVVTSVISGWRHYLQEFAAGGVSGEVLHDLSPLTPAQADFIRQDLPEPNYWNSAALFTVPRRLAADEVQRCVRMLGERHHVLQARFVRARQGLRQAWVDEPPPVTVFTLPGDDPAERDRKLHRMATGLHQSLDLNVGPVCRVGFFRCDNGPDRLLLIVHHALLDLYSWDVLTEDLSSLLRYGCAHRLPAMGTSSFAWARRLADEMQRNSSRWDPRYWLSTPWHSGMAIPADGWGVQRDLEVITTELGSARTRRFLDSRPGQPTVNARLIAALGRAMQKWLGRPDGDVLVQLGGHGREDLFADMDISGTVGYFSTSHPFLLPLPGFLDQPAYIALIAERLGQIPDNGLSFGLLRHLHPDPDLRKALDAIPTPAVVFDFLREPRSQDASGDDRHANFLRDAGTDHAGAARPPGMPRSALLDIRVSIADQLSVSWLFSGQALPAARVQELAHAYEAAFQIGDEERLTSR